MTAFFVLLLWFAIVSALSTLVRPVRPRLPVTDPPRQWSCVWDSAFDRAGMLALAGSVPRPGLEVVNIFRKPAPPKPVAVADHPPTLLPASQPTTQARPEPQPAPVRKAGYQPRVPVVFVLDKSPSEALHQEEIYSAFGAAVAEMKQDPVTANCGEVCVVEFNTEAVVSRFTAIAGFTPAQLLPVQGGTNLGLATERALDALDARIAELRGEGAPIKRKLMIVLSDFCTYDSLEVLARRLHPAETKDKDFAVLPIGVGQVNTDVMNAFSSKRKGQFLRNENGVPDYKSLFSWIKLVIGAFSRSRPNERVELPPTDGWHQM